MASIKLVVIDKPGADHLRVLDTLPESIRVDVSNQAALLREAVQQADVILNGIPDGHLLRDIFPHATRLRWVHSLSDGVEKILFPELVASFAILTNARGVFKKALAEFVIGAVVYFAKDFRRLIRSQQASVWQQFEMEEVHGKVMGIVGYGETGRACAERARPLARIIHDFGDKKSLLWYKHVEMTMFEAPKEAFAWVTTPQQSVFCFPISFRSPSSRNLTSGKAVPMAAPSC